MPQNTYALPGGPYAPPGVYVVEVDGGPQPIAGAGTSTAGFVGVVPEGVGTAPAGIPTLITNWGAFKSAFGDFQTTSPPAANTLAHAVYGFFLNGGARCWVAGVNSDEPIDKMQAIDAFAAIDEIAIVAAPGDTTSYVQGYLLEHCESQSLNRFAVLDGPWEGDSGWLTSPPIAPPSMSSPPTPGEVSDWVQYVSAGPTSVASLTSEDGYGAMYWPWISVFDPPTQGSITVPPSGHVAGIYARVDANRGVYKAPANEVVMGALDVGMRISRDESGTLNGSRINAIRPVDGAVTVYGARTLASDSNWKYVPVRRLFLFLRESIADGTDWVVFEPNTPTLWAQITRSVTAFLTMVWRSGALLWTTPADAFYVLCDESTNPQEVRDAGQVVTEIGVKIVDPAEFVVFQISQWAAGSNGS